MILKQPPLLVIVRALVAFMIFDENALSQHKSKVAGCPAVAHSSSPNHQTAKTILGLCSLSISILFWKWLDPSVEDMDDSELLSSSHFWSSFMDFLSFLLLFSRDLSDLDMELIDLLVTVDLVDLSTELLALDFFLVSMIFACASGLSAFHSGAFSYLPDPGELSPAFTLLLLVPGINAVPCAGTVGVFNLSGLYSLIRVNDLWMSVR